MSEEEVKLLYRRVLTALGALLFVILEVGAFDYLKRSDMAVLMWHIPVVMALLLTIQAVRGGTLTLAVVFTMIIVVVGGLLFFSGGLILSGVALLWLLLTAVGQLAIQGIRERHPDPRASDR
jgi:hypothetical protein